MTDSLLTIITGASSGIGAAMAAAADDAGHTVATVSRRPGPGRHLAADLAQPSEWGDVATWIDGLIDERSWRRVALVHNAGTLEPIGFAGEVDHDAYVSNVLLNSAAGQVLGDRFIASINRVTDRGQACEATICLLYTSDAADE